MAARKTKATKGSGVASLPKGFEAIGGFGKTWPDENTKPGEAIQGVVTEYHEKIKTVHGLTDNLKLETEDGEVFTVWNSAGLRSLFEDDYVDVAVFIRYDGMGKKQKGKNAPRLYTVAAETE